MLRTFICAAVLLFATTSFTQSWKEIDDSRIATRNSSEREIIPSQYKVFTSDIDEIKSLLKSASKEGLRDISQRISMSLPYPDGSIVEFQVFESPCMQEKLSAKYPSIKSFKGISESGDITRFDISPYGLRASVITNKGEFYIDPYVKEDLKNSIVYYTKDFGSEQDGSNYTCGVTGENIEFTRSKKSSTRGINVDVYEYELAISCTGEWGAKRGTVEKALADMNTSVNRLNQIFENELAYRVILINDNDKIVFIDAATDPFSTAISRTGGELIPVNTTIVNNYLGHSNYDYGHVFTVGCTDVGGVAFLSSVCNPSNKAGGCTCFANNSVIPTTVSIVAHEMGHQFSAQHTFNNCGGNESAFGVEPGSGSTIMSYAGLCGSNNVLADNYDFYHSISLSQIESHTRNGGSAEGCATIYPTSNISPDIQLDYEDGFYIPTNTSFYLLGHATDANNDNLTYGWEQINTGPISSLGNPLGNSPLFVVYPPSDKDFRIFPQKSSILNNIGFNVEVLPKTSRDLDFNFVVRDNNPEGGYTEWESVSFHSKLTEGTFAITYPNETASFNIGDVVDVTWDVAQTDQAPINAKFVDIYFSHNGAIVPEREGDDMVILACQVPNDGEHEVIIPNFISAKGRILVKASDNIFFDISDKYFSVEESSTPSFNVSNICEHTTVCLPESKEYAFTTEAFGGFNDKLKFEVIDLPESISANFSQDEVTPGETSTLYLDFDQMDGINDYELSLRITSENADTMYRKISLTTIGTDFSDFYVTLPADNSVGISVSPEFEWVTSINADSYLFQLSDDPKFNSNTANYFYEKSTTADNVSLPSTLEKSTIYYYRVAPVNQCGVGSFSDIRAFSTKVQSCKTTASTNVPKNISGSGLPTVDISTVVSDNVPLDDISVTIEGEHNRMNDLTLSLISPSLKEVVLVNRKCPTQKVISVTFDDEGIDFACNYDKGITVKPTGNLSDFEGEPIQGLWIMRVKDNEAGEGGRIDNVILDICSSVALNAPYLVNNVAIQTTYNQTIVLQSNQLLCEDSDNSANELTYTVTTIPVQGNLYKDQQIILEGDQFTQEDINQGKIKYWTIFDELETTDLFKFSVSDGNGGWIPTTQFNINIKNTSSTKDLLEDDFKIFPNPTRSILNLVARNHTDNVEYSIFSVDGKAILSGTFNKNTNINIENLNSGIYLVKFLSDSKQVVKKLVVE